MTKTFLLVATFLIAFLINAQRIPASGVPKMAGRPQIRYSHPGDLLTEFNQIVYAGSLILDGTVTSALPSINRGEAHPYDIETHIFVHVTEMLHGTLPEGGDTVLIGEDGGKTDKAEVVYADNPMAKPGERYILFLWPDQRNNHYNSTDKTLYLVAGMYAGKAKIESGKVHFMPAASPELHSYDGTDIEQFKAILRDAIRARFP